MAHDDGQQKGDRIIMAKSAKKLKSMTLKEFEKAAEQFDNDDPSIYNLCRKDYPDILAELEKEDDSFSDLGCRSGNHCFDDSRNPCYSGVMLMWYLEHLVCC
ncbi:hypothetical protein [[Clostridium] scindens]|nr:hypothetical protein [[Clostridium] scindens]